MALRKGFPKERNHDFWNIVMCYLIHKDTSTPEKESALFGTLAYRLICKAAETVPIDKVGLVVMPNSGSLANHTSRTSF